MIRQVNEELCYQSPLIGEQIVLVELMVYKYRMVFVPHARVG